MISTPTSSRLANVISFDMCVQWHQTFFCHDSLLRTHIFAFHFFWNSIWSALFVHKHYAAVQWCWEFSLQPSLATFSLQPFRPQALCRGAIALEFSLQPYSLAVCRPWPHDFFSNAAIRRGNAFSSPCADQLGFWSCKRQARRIGYEKKYWEGAHPEI